MQETYSLDKLGDFSPSFSKPCLVFLYGDLGTGKTTLCQHIIQKINPEIEYISSPTYVYYNIYGDIYHFDLYRLTSYDEFVSIGGEEILDNNEGIIFIEWPQILEKYYSPDMKIHIEKTEHENQRNIIVEYKS